MANSRLRDAGLKPLMTEDPLRAYGAALVVTGAAVLARIALTPLIGAATIPFITFYPAVLFAAWYGGFRAGAASALLSVLAAAYFFVPSARSFWTVNSVDQISLSLFLLVSLAVARQSHSHRQALARAAQEAARRGDAENAERQQRQWFETTLASIGDAVVATDNQGRVTFLNGVAQSMTGWRSEQAAGLPLDQVFVIRNAETGAVAENPVSKVLREGRIVGLANHTRLVAKDGRYIPIDDSAAPIRDAAGNLTGVVLVFRDITEREKAEARLRLAVEAAPNAMIMVGRDGRIALVNSQSEKLFGYRREEMVGQLVEVLVPERYRARHGALRGSFFHAPSARSMGAGRDLFGVRKDGSEVPIEIGLNPINTEQGDFVLASIIDITERKKSEARFRMMADNAPVLIWISGLDKGCIWCNKPWLDFVGRNPEQVLGDGWAEHIHPDDVDGCLKTYATSFDAREPFRMEYRMKRHDGQFRWLMDQGTPLYDASEFTGYIRSCVDITGRKEAEEALREREKSMAIELAATRRLQEISTRLIREDTVEEPYGEILDAAVAIMRSEFGSIQMLDPKRGAEGELRLLAYRGFNAQAAKFWEWVNPESKSACGAALRAGERVVVYDVEQSEMMTGSEDRERYLQTGIHAVQTTPLLSRSGELLGMLSTHWRAPHRPSERDLQLFDVLARQAADVIERSQADMALRASEARLADQKEALELAVSGAPIDVTLDVLARASQRQIGNGAGTAIFLVGAARLRFAAAAGMSPQYSQAADGIFPIGPHESSCGAAVFTGQPVIVRDVRTNPLWAPFLPLAEAHGIRACWSFPIRSHGGQALGTLAVYHGTPGEPDGQALEGAGLLTKTAGLIIERHQQAEIRRQAEEELRRANADLNQFAFAASHDLQEPLRMITSYSELLLKGYPSTLGGEASMCVKFITEGTKRMRELLADLLAYTQVNADESKAIEPVDLNAVFQEAVENLKIAIAQSGAVVTSEKLPVATGQKAHFLQLFQNLISNAIKYSGGRPPRVQITAVQQNGGWQVAVADNGMGIDPDYHQNIFGVFKRLHGKSIPGTGIGLAICQRVVERYGGRIWVESQVNEGATFYFTLPAGKERVHDRGTGSQPAGGG